MMQKLHAFVTDTEGYIRRVSLGLKPEGQYDAVAQEALDKYVETWKTPPLAVLVTYTNGVNVCFRSQHRVREVDSEPSVTVMWADGGITRTAATKSTSSYPRQRRLQVTYADDSQQLYDPLGFPVAGTYEYQTTVLLATHHQQGRCLFTSGIQELALIHENGVTLFRSKVKSVTAKTGKRYEVVS